MGRRYGVNLYRNPTFDEVEFRGKANNLGFDEDDTKVMLANLRPLPTGDTKGAGTGPYSSFAQMFKRMFKAT